jgi:UDP-N-acetylglucosamine acyltransferase
LTATAGAPPRIHPTSVVGVDVELAPDVVVGPLCLLDGKIRLGRGTRLIGHVTILGITEFGAENVLHPGVVIGDEPQDLTYTGVARSVKIGNRNVFRECCTVHRGSERGDVTIIGDDNFMMQNSHVAHDCRIGNSTIIAGGALLAGWVEVGDRVLVSGNCVVHQYTRIGRLAMMRGLSRTSRDVPPFCIMDGTHTLRGINVIGLKRAGVPSKSIHALRHAFTALFGTRQNLKLAVERFTKSAEAPNCPEVTEMLDFIRASKRGVAFGPLDDRASDTEDDSES